MSETDRVSMYQEDGQSLIEVVHDSSGASYTIEHAIKFVITLYSKDRHTILVKHVGDLARAKEWAQANFWQVR
jgi:hypothetical protein